MLSILKANNLLPVFVDFSHFPDLGTPLILRRESLIWAVMRQMSQTFRSMTKKKSMNSFHSCNYSGSLSCSKNIIFKILEHETKMVVTQSGEVEGGPPLVPAPKLAVPLGDHCVSAESLSSSLPQAGANEVLRPLYPKTETTGFMMLWTVLLQCTVVLSFTWAWCSH